MARGMPLTCRTSFPPTHTPTPLPPQNCIYLGTNRSLQLRAVDFVMGCRWQYNVRLVKEAMYSFGGSASGGGGC